MMSIDETKQHIVDELKEDIERYANLKYTDGYIDGYITGEKQTKQRWIPVSERQPEEDGMYYVTVRDSKGNIDAIPCLWFSEKWGIGGVEVIAWIEIPEPYKGEQK